jgi:RHS repeat-associated protein
MMPLTHRLISFVALFVILAVLPAAAQQPQYPYAVDTKPSRGIMPNSEQLSGPLDHIDPVTGKLHIQIPLASLPAGNAGSGFDLALTYDSHVYDMGVGWITKANGETVLSQTVTPTLTGGGWSYNFKNYRVESEARLFPPDGDSCEGNAFHVMEHEREFRYRISLPDGSQHLLHLLGYGDEKDGYYGDGFYAIGMAGLRSFCASQHPGRYPANVTGKLTYYTTDGSYLRFEIHADGSSWTNQQWTLFYPDGRRVVGRYDQAEHIYDANGNGIHITKATENGHTVSYITDDFDRSIRIEHSLASSPTEKEDKITVNGPHGPLEWRVKWHRIQIGGSGASYVCYEDTSVNPPDKLSCPFNFLNWVVKYIQLPLAAPNFTPPPAAPWTNFEFTHTASGIGFGRLTSMRVPSGALYSYCCDVYSPSLYAQTIAHGGYAGRTVSHDGVNETWSYQRSQSGRSIVTNPDKGQTIYHYYDPHIASQFWSRGLVYWIEEPGGTVRKRQWTRNKVFSLAAAINIDSNNPYVERESVTVDKVIGEPRSAVTDILIDKNGNLLRKKEYGWSATLAGAAMENPGALLRTTESSYYVSVPASTEASNGTNRYWNPSTPPRLNAALRSTISDEFSTIKAVTEFTYDDPYTKGNVIAERRWDDETLDCTNSTPLPATCPSQQRGYDSKGNLIDVFAPAIRTHVAYENGPYPTRVEYAPGTTSYRSFRYDWNVAAGTLNYQEDEQNGITTAFEYDAYGRQSSVNEAGLRITRTAYHEEDRSVLVKHDLRTFDDGALQTISRADQLGRVDLVRRSDGMPLSLTGNDGIKVTTVYQTFDGGTRVFTSSPYRTAAEPGMQWTCTQRDQSGRVVIAAQFNGASAPTDCQSAPNRTGATLTDYHVGSGTPRTRVTDPAGSIIDNFSDALGRLTTVVEDPAVKAFTTTYQYGVFDNLKSSTQTAASVTQLRDFTYSSLGRLTTATNPETGMIKFTYKPSGDLHTRLDARNVLTTLNYDDLHRIDSKSFSNDGDVTPDVQYEYHTAAPCVGQLKSVTSTAGTTSNSSCDALGRVLGSAQSIAGPGGGSYIFNYSYWLNDSLKSMQYPSGKLVNYDIDNAGRAMRVYTATDTHADLTIASTPPYRPDGRLTKMKFGNGLWETRDYQVPGVATVLSLGTTEGAADRLELQYNYAATSNNGNLLSHVIKQGSTAWSQTYDYDALNRLTCATETTGPSPAGSCSAQNSWRQTYGYDRFGNRWVESSSGFNFVDVHEFSTEDFIDKTTNRVVGQVYDPAGNLTTYSPWSMTYDAENRMTSLSSAGNGNSTFTYDGNGRRIKKVTTIPASQTTLYVYDAGGRLAAEYSTTPSPSGTSYLFADLLGTPRAVTAANGSLQECSDYSPFGRLLDTPTRTLACHQIPSHASQQFTGQVRDQETKLDYFGARYYSGAQGRFLGPDQPMIDQGPADPQSWNLYSYVRNNPLKYIDPTGRDCIYSGSFDSKGTVSVQRGNCSRNGGTFVDGTVDTDSLTYNVRKKTLGYRYSTGSDGGIGAGVIGLAPVPGDELDSKGLAFVTAMSTRVDASNRMIATLAGTSVAAGAAPAVGNFIASTVAKGIGWGYGITGGSGVVLGKYFEYPNYIDAARAMNANVYNIPDRLWSILNFAGQAWTTNRAFLDASIWRGQQFFLNTPPVGVDGYYAMELRYLISKGITPDKWQMVRRPF